jgi:long-chain acyl-CoA synthetase
VLHRIRALFGGRLDWAASGAAPLNPEVAEFFFACGVPIVEGLGMTENASLTNVNRLDRNKLGTVGPVVPGVEMKLAEDGEILFRGPNVMKGYFRDPQATAEAIDADGWLRTGDIGEIDDEGFLRITDRKKDLIVTAGGKNIAPQRVEGILCRSRFVRQALAYGDRRKYLTALIVIDPDQLRRWAASEGLSLAEGAALAADPRVRERIQAEVDRANAELASYESVKKFEILPRELTVEEGDLTPTLKVRRKAVYEKYRELLDRMYPA